MKRTALFLGLSLLFSSCLELKEQAHFNNDGSGSFQFVLDLGPIRDMLNLIAQFSGETTDDLKSDMHDEFASAIQEIESISGISNVQGINNDKSFVYGLSFDFKDVNALNKALAKTFDISEEKNAVFFEWHKNRLIRKDPLNIRREIEEELEDSKDMIEGIDPSAFLSSLKYSTEYTFDKKVNKSSNNIATFSLDKKTVKVEYYLMSREAETQSIENEIGF